MAFPLINPGLQFFDDTGEPLAGGLLYSYAPGTTTPKTTYTDENLSVPNANPIVLDSAGRCTVFLTDGEEYKFVLKTSAGVTLWTRDEIKSPSALTAANIGAGLYPQTGAETSAAITPTNKAYPSLNEFRYGFTGGGGGEDSTARAAVASVLAQITTANQWANGLAIAGFPQTPGELSASSVPLARFLEGDVRRQGAKFDNSNDDTAEIVAAIGVADGAVSGSTGNTVDLPQGTAIVSTQITLPNRVRLRGRNTRGTTIKAHASHAGPYMFNAVNGTSSMFDSLLEDLFIDCNDVASLGAILSDAWQENSGLRRVVIYKFRTYGLLVQNGYGGAATLSLRNCEIFASTSGATAGIKVTQISAVGAFMLSVRDTVITGTSGVPLPKCIDIVKDSLHAYDVHFEHATSGIYLDGVGHHVLIGVNGASTVTTLVEIASTFTGTVRMLGCFRNGATNFLVDNRSGGLGTITGYDIADLTIGTAAAAVRSDANISAWCKFDGTASSPITPDAGFNVTSVTKSATGTYRVNLTRAMKSANFAGNGSCNLANNSTHVRFLPVSASSFDIYVYVAGVLTDASVVTGFCIGG